MGGTSQFVDKYVMNGSTANLGQVAGESDSGCASGLDVAWAGAQFGGNLALNVVPGGGEAWAGDAAGNVIKGVVSKRFNEEQQLVLDLAKEANREGGVSWDEGETLVEWAKDAGSEGHGPEIHSATRPSSWAGKNWHVNIGNMHIPVK